mgnify:CR=1 FL=1
MIGRVFAAVAFVLALALPLEAADLPPIAVDAVSEDETYGYQQSNPIKVGGGPSREREYLNLLRGPNGEAVRFSRDGSCCGFATPNSPFGGGMLDIYSVWIGDRAEPVKLYLNMYDYEQPKAPKGFTFATRLRRK